MTNVLADEDYDSFEDKANLSSLEWLNTDSDEDEIEIITKRDQIEEKYSDLFFDITRALLRFNNSISKSGLSFIKKQYLLNISNNMIANNRQMIKKLMNLLDNNMYLAAESYVGLMEASFEDFKKSLRSGIVEGKILWVPSNHRISWSIPKHVKKVDVSPRRLKPCPEFI